MERLGAYELTSSFTNQNAGYSVWGFGKKDGKEYFIKQFVERKYPANDTVSNPARLQKRIKECERFEQKKRGVYQTLNDTSDGNAVRVEEFFRVESKYYIAMQKINAVRMNVSDIAMLPETEIRRLCAIVAHTIAGLHSGHLIHADLKPDNILFTETAAGSLTAKIIDFDSGFLESAPPGPGETIVGDFHYFSPEACRTIWGEEEALTCKMDVFALGVLFHQYFTGQLPGYDMQESSYSGEAVAKGEVLTVSDELPEDIAELLTRMLDIDPEIRPTAMEVFYAMRGVEEESESDEDTLEESAPNWEEETDFEPVIEISTTRENPFFRPGDL